MTVTITLTIPPAWVITENRDGGNRWDKAKRRKWIRQYAAIEKVQQARDAHLDAAHCTATIAFRTKQTRDAHNWMPTIKPAIDGFVGGGYRRPKGAGPWPYALLPDDSGRYLVGPDLREAHDPTLNPRTIRITFTFTAKDPDDD